jgi:ribonuclease Z
VLIRHGDTALQFDAGRGTVLRITEAGAMAEAAGGGRLVLTHLIPPPLDAAGEQAFADDVREGGYTGPLTVGYDLFTIELT